MFETENFWEDSSNDNKTVPDALFGSPGIHVETSVPVSTSSSTEKKKSKRKRGKKKSKISLKDGEDPDNHVQNKHEDFQTLHKKAKTNKFSSASATKDEALSNASKNNQRRVHASNFYKKLLTSLDSSRFRYINEQMYTKHSSETFQMFKDDPKAFDTYHSGYQAQVKKWDVNPLQVILTWIKKRSSKLVVADLGCGEAWIAQKVKNKVHSFDLVAVNEHITVADIAKVPLGDESVDIVILCLSLMGTNLNEIVFEANRILKAKGILKVAEVASRFMGINSFIKAMKRFGFHVIKRDLNHTHFFMFDFQKRESAKSSTLDGSMRGLQLKPCLYKKR